MGNVRRYMGFGTQAKQAQADVLSRTPWPFQKKKMRFRQLVLDLVARTAVVHVIESRDQSKTQILHKCHSYSILNRYPPTDSTKKCRKWRSCIDDEILNFCCRVGDDVT